MSRVKVNITMSLDGFVVGPNQSENDPLGIGGYWGDDPPYHHPVFVLTRYPRKPLELQGGTTFHFVTKGIESALEQAQAAAGDKDVSIGGGANFLGGGTCLFENLGEPKPRLRQVQVVEAPGVTHVRYARA
jgi:hypothetical protein